MKLYQFKGVLHMKNYRISVPSRPTQILLHIELSLTIIYAVFFLISYLMALKVNPVLANIYYRPLLVYLLYPCMITAFSVLLLERLLR